MKNLSLLFFLLLANLFVFAQTIAVSGQCISGTSTLNRIADVNGRPAYQGTGTVQGFSGVTISIYWLPAPDNLWVLDFDGQPYFMSNCLRTTPPSTTNSSCTWVAVSGQSCTGGVALSISGTGTLPVRLSNFSATQVGSQVQLYWKTLSETNNKGFDIQRSSDGSNWTSIGFISGAGTSTQEKNYRFDDGVPLRGKNYYRLLQIDYDNNTSISSTVMVSIATKGFYTLQNPGSGLYNVQIDSDESIELTVVDLNGKKLFSKKVVNGLHSIDIRPYAQGVYLLQLRKDNLILTEKLVKQ